MRSLTLVGLLATAATFWHSTTSPSTVRLADASFIHSNFTAPARDAAFGAFDGSGGRREEADIVLVTGAATDAQTDDEGQYGHHSDEHHHGHDEHDAMNHKCIHDSPVLKELFARDIHSAAQHYSAEHRAFNAHASSVTPPTGAANVRFTISTLDLDDPTKYCTTDTSTQIVSDFSGGSVYCSQTDFIFTPAKKSILLDKVVPAALKILSDALLVTPIAGNVNVGNGCTYFNVPQAHKTNGVPNADFVIYIAAAPTSGSTVAWAGTCVVDSATGRPVTGRANFNPKYLVWTADVKKQTTLVRTAVHELLHAMGFSEGMFNTRASALGKAIITTETRRVTESRKVVVSANSVLAAQNHFNCSTLTGAELEDEGGSGTAGSHWDRRNHLDDVMAGIIGEGMYLSPLTLGTLVDLGFYWISPTWPTENPLYMRNAGCGVYLSSCNTAAGGLGTYFCDPSASSLATCTQDYRAVGVCGAQTLMNSCATVVGYSNTICDDGVAGRGNSSIWSEYYGSDGKCFKTSVDVIQTGYTSSSATMAARCMRTRCVTVSNTQYVEFSPGDGTSTTWVRCQTPNQVITLAAYGYKGSLTCPPDSTAHCPAAAAVTTTTTTTTAAPTTPTTTHPSSSAATSAATNSATSTTTGGATTTGHASSSTTSSAPSSTTGGATNGATTTGATSAAASTTSTTRPSTTTSTTSTTTTTTTTTSTTTTPTTTTTTTTTTVPAPTGVPATPAPASVRPLAPITNFISFTLVASDIDKLLLTMEAFRTAVAADVGSHLGITNTSTPSNGIGGGGVSSLLVDQHLATTVMVAGRQVPAVTVRLLVSTATRASSFLLTMWLYGLNKTKVTEPVSWMSLTQQLYRANGGGVASSSAALTHGFFSAADTPFLSIADPQIAEPTKDTAFLAECGPLGCVATVAVATMGGWAAVVLVLLALYHCCTRSAHVASVANKKFVPRTRMQQNANTAANGGNVNQQQQRRYTH